PGEGGDDEIGFAGDRGRAHFAIAEIRQGANIGGGQTIPAEESGKRTVECTKRMMSVQVYTLLRTYGWELWDENVTCLYDLASKFAKMIQQRSELELAIEPQANIVCFRYIPANTSAAQLSDLNAQIRQQILEEGKFYIVLTQLKGEVFLRVTLMNPFTTEAMLNELLDNVIQRGEDLQRAI
ncbi:MAG: pyridoxal-dependent decarboxylase, partial [Bacteroidota bacterium]